MPAKKTVKEKLIVEQVEFETFEEAIENIKQDLIAESTLQQPAPVEEQPVSQKKSHPARPMPQAKEQYDLNLVVVSGVIGRASCRERVSIDV